MDELLIPCPFCGGEARISFREFDGAFIVETWVVAMCSACGIRTPKYFYTPEHGEQEKRIAIESVTSRWNRRVQEVNE